MNPVRQSAEAGSRRHSGPPAGTRGRTGAVALLLIVVTLGLAAALAPAAARAQAARIKIPSLDVLVPIYTGGMSPGEVERIEKGLALARLFYWRNTSCRLDLQIHFMPISAPTPDTRGASFNAIEADLRARGIRDNQYDAVFATGDGMDGCWGGFLALGSTGAAFGRSCGVPYPGNDPDVDYNITWTFTHEFGHVLDLVIARLSGHPEMLFNHFPWIYPLPAGEVFNAGPHYDGMAEVLRRFNAYDRFAAPWNGYIETTDADGDGFPDDDPRLAMDEVRFGSSPNAVDTDGDGLTDLAEFTAGIFSGTDPRDPDTDHDGVRDGDDPYPLDRLEPSLRRATATPRIDGRLDASWPLLATGLRYSGDPSLTASLYGSWDDDHLYLALVTSREVRAYISIDGSPENGRFESDGLYAGSGTTVDSMRGDCWGDGREFRATWGEKGLMSGTAAVPGAQVASGVDGRNHVIEIALPRTLPPGTNYTWSRPGLPPVTGLHLAEGRSIGLAVTLGILGSGVSDDEFSGNWATFFEPYRYHAVILNDGSGALAMSRSAVSPRRLEFAAASPNPTPGATRFSFVVPGSLSSGNVATELALFDVNGRRVRTLVSSVLAAGTHDVRWDGRDLDGAPVAAGVYFAKLVAGGEVLTQKLTVLR